jgi:hypothetical protein
MEKYLKNSIKNREEDIRKVLKEKAELQERIDQEAKRFEDECLRLKLDIVRKDCMKQVLTTKVKEIQKFIEKGSGKEKDDVFIEKTQNTLELINRVKEKTLIEMKSKKKMTQEVSELSKLRDKLKQKVKILKEKKEFLQETSEDSLHWIRTRDQRRLSASSNRFQIKIFHFAKP